MLLLIGLVLLAAAVVFGVDELVNNNPVGLPDPQVFGQSLGITSGRGLFLIGVATGAGVVLGLFLLLAGVRHGAARRASRRQERKALRRERRDREALAAENQTLRQRLEERDVEGPPAAPVERTAAPVGSEADPTDQETGSAAGWAMPAAAAPAIQPGAPPAGAGPATTAGPAVSEDVAGRQAARSSVVTRPRRRWWRQ